ncbi:MAG: bifunctional riboflavin kinase/FAD synthetase [Candidatus Omnitrophica bacterium]|nr:bifunctional riboflavin kinase/FAD synthetase [Candidatus Omnitrophota bacterium]
MRIFHGVKSAKGLHAPSAAIGNFDGVHLGHQAVIRRLLRDGGAGGDKIIITFDPHPRTVLRKGNAPLRIMPLEHRLRIFEKEGIDAVVIIKFTKRFSLLSPEDFIKQTLVPLGCRKVFVGCDFHFGKGRMGDAAAVEEAGKKYGISIFSVSPVKKNGTIVSSTRVRELIAAGELEKASKLLARPVSVLGTVVKGDERGRELGFPTANIDPHHEITPPPGVYAVRACIKGKYRGGVANIGFRPTFYGTRRNEREEPLIEVFIFDFKENIYGTNIEVQFLKMLRREKKFGSKEALVRQIRKDIARAKTIVRSGSPRPLTR